MAIEMNRRELLQLMALAGALGLVPKVYAKSAKGAAGRALVLVELQGGNDSLNTFIPRQQESQYQTLRPNLYLKQDERFTLDEQFDAHSALLALKPAWMAKELSLVHGLGYEEPNLSHFRSIEIWDTASDSDSYKDSGWLTSLSNRASMPGIDAVVLGRNSGPVAGGEKRTVLQADLLRGILGAGQKLSAIDAADSLGDYGHLLSVQNTLNSVAKELLPILRDVNAMRTSFPTTKFGKQLGEISQLIGAGIDIPVYKVALQGFDTHRNQKPTHARLLLQLAEGLSAFREEMIRVGRWDQVTVMTYSEFGRRPKMNGSGGTDHGTAASHIVMGGKVKGGHIGGHPELPEKDNANMQFTTDFRALYQSILDQWFERPDIRLSEHVSGNLPLYRNI